MGWLLGNGTPIDSKLLNTLIGMLSTKNLKSKKLANVLVYLFLNEIIGRLNGNSVDYYMIRWVFQTMEYVWNAFVGSNQRWNCCSLFPFPCENTLVWTIYGSPDRFPKNSKSISSCVGPREDNCRKLSSINELYKITTKP